ncbi:TPA: phage minor tail protein G [Salmonella enterica subsp. enterica serovar Dublin]|nr:phage minor tail protein G [Salmonella enterica]ECM3181902.1 phage minor tail protein G [Salmonella enterica subsp. enterica serovar Newport]HBM0023432.1 phage minor tail protein G [Salmonella enterica subsp. enterica serovar Muenchen]HDN6462068.1 phage minor tail protein G [Salmonella enterica subsp. enterica serovar Dublin]EEM8614169.1 phage minor tail protein G [Salmonella enterica]
MFLKKDTLNYGDDSVELHELSGLQRIEYLEFIQKRTAKYDTDMEGATEADKRVAYIQMALEINAWLVSRSLQNSDLTQDADTLYQSVQMRWSYEALDAGAEMVLTLSGLAVTEKGKAGNSGEQQEDMTPEKS